MLLSSSLKDLNNLTSTATIPLSTMRPYPLFSRISRNPLAWKSMLVSLTTSEWTEHSIPLPVLLQLQQLLQEAGVRSTSMARTITTVPGRERVRVRVRGRVRVRVRVQILAIWRGKPILHLIIIIVLMRVILWRRTMVLKNGYPCWVKCKLVQLANNILQYISTPRERNWKDHHPHPQQIHKGSDQEQSSIVQS